MKKDIRLLYGKRSRVTHGAKEAISPDELYRMMDIAYRLVKALIDRLDDFKSRADLRNWLEDQKLS